MKPQLYPELNISMIDEYPARSVIGFPITALPFEQQIQLLLRWAKSNLSKVVCVANVHMLIEGYRNPSFAAVLQEADLVTPDGMPLVWMLKLTGAPYPRSRSRAGHFIVGLPACILAECQRLFLGSQQVILEHMKQRLEREFPALEIAGMEPLPFRPMTPVEDEAIIQRLNDSGAGIVFISLGCPKQEVWMAQHKDKVKAVMIGLGGAFPVYAGLHKRAPSMVRSAGFEWLYRLVQEPRRLWRRYFDTIPLFMVLAFKQLLIRPRDIPTKEM